jgi:hypothetical protein
MLLRNVVLAMFLPRSFTLIKDEYLRLFWDLFLLLYIVPTVRLRAVSVAEQPRNLPPTQRGKRHYVDDGACPNV